MPHTGCKFYGCAAVPDMGMLWKPPGQSNRCGLVVLSHAPCMLERQGRAPNLENCPVKIAMAPAMFDELNTYQRIEG